MENGKVKVALVGLSFGAEFVPIYLKHPDVGSVVLVDQDPKVLGEIGDKFEAKERLSSIEDVLSDPSIDAVHLVTPPATHAPLSVKVLESGKHCACTIPMGMSMDELNQVIAARKASGKQYMFMETAVYTREFLHVKEMVEAGQFGPIQFMRCAHYQDMEGWPDYWMGFPPLMHPTHAVAPCLVLAGKRPTQVYAKGSGKVREELAERYGCPYSFESALITLDGDAPAIEMARFLFHVARGYTESFNVYGEERSFEWQQIESEKPVLFTRNHDSGQHGFRGMTIDATYVDAPDYAHLLPDEIARFTQKTIYDESNPHLSFIQGGGHGGSHPHLVNEFVRAICEDRSPAPNDIDGAYWTAVGILAHNSAMEGGTIKNVPVFE